MDDKILNNEQWTELWEAIALFDEKNDRTVLNRVLVSIMKNVIETLDDDSPTDEEDDMEKQLAITLIEIELAELIAVNG
jgi:hypothetical protein